MRVVGHHVHRGAEGRFVTPPTTPPVVWPRPGLRSELLTSHDLGTDALAPQAGQCAVNADGGIRHLVNAVDPPAVEPSEEFLCTADRLVVGDVPAGCEAVERDAEVVDPSAGQVDSLLGPEMRPRDEIQRWADCLTSHSD